MQMVRTEVSVKRTRGVVARSAPRGGSTPDINYASIYEQLGYLMVSRPDLLSTDPGSPEAMQWLGRAYALVQVVGDDNDSIAFRQAVTKLNGPAMGHWVRIIDTIVYRALAIAELQAPAGAQGAFIPAGGVFDAMAAVAKVLRSATSAVLIVDPYMDEIALTDFAVVAPEAVTVRLLADQASHKLSLKPAVTRWIAQHGATRPVEARLASPRTLHDRLIVVDESSVWILTQSLNAFATRAPGMIHRVNPDTAVLKAVAYSEMWQAARPL